VSPVVVVGLMVFVVTVVVGIGIIWPMNTEHKRNRKSEIIAGVLVIGGGALVLILFYLVGR
jgi:uncharacterized membrane protein